MTATTDGDPALALRHRDGDPTKLHLVPEPLRRVLAPAEWAIYEWTPYVVERPGATALQIGSSWHKPIAPGVFVVSFENQLGLAAIQAHDERGPIGDPLWVEVLAGKFTSPAQSVAFLERTVGDLFARAAASPFALGAATERMVRDASAPPNALFAFHFFRRRGDELIRALQAIQGRPHQRLSADPELVRPGQVRQLDRDSLVRMLRAGRPAPVELDDRVDRLTPLQRLRPERVWQQLPVETRDTPENRFVLAASRRLLGAAQALRRSPWFDDPIIDAPTRRRIARVAEHLTMLTVDDRFAPLGPMAVVPTHSRVLQRRDGYRELTLLWHIFQRSRQPIFEAVQQAIDLRNIAELYEYWVWFELIDRIQASTGATPVHRPVLDAFGVPGWRSQVEFGGHGTLFYNRTMGGYSGIALRPDYLWERADGSLVALDAKFRMQRPTELFDETSGAVTIRDERRATTEDLQKMHAYRDAIDDVRAAVVLYPGHVAAFRSPDRQRRAVGLTELLTGAIEGVGAIPMSPLSLNQTEETRA